MLDYKDSTHIIVCVMRRPLKTFSSKVLITLYFSGRVCYDLAGIQPISTEISFEALEKMSLPYGMEGSENLSLR